MKTFRLSIAFIVIYLAIAPQAKADSHSRIATESSVSPEDADKAEALTRRLEEIKAIDKNAMNRSEKRQLRKEVKVIERELKNLNDGVYLSVGAIIIIILLLILLV